MAAPGSSGASLPTGGEKRMRVQEMFDRIAPRYDRLNRMISLGLDQGWRRLALDLIDVRAGDTVVDLACGTGDLSEEARKRGATVVGVDFARQMLHGASRRSIDAAFVQGDAAALPFGTGSATVLTCGFALRNFVSLPEVFAECARILAPGGRLAIVEVDRPPNGLIRFGHSLYFDRVVPMLGGILSDRAAYQYLPESTAYLPEPPELLAMIEGAGFERVVRKPRLLSSAQIIYAARSAEPAPDRATSPTPETAASSPEGGARA